MGTLLSVLNGVLQSLRWITARCHGVFFFPTSHYSTTCILEFAGTGGTFFGGIEGVHSLDIANGESRGVTARSLTMLYFDLYFYISVGTSRVLYPFSCVQSPRGRTQ